MNPLTVLPAAKEKSSKPIGFTITGPPKRRKTFWGEDPQQNERTVTFLQKVAASDMTLAATIWRRVRDSNPRGLVGLQHFECCTFDHSDNSPFIASQKLQIP